MPTTHQPAKRARLTRSSIRTIPLALDIEDGCQQFVFVFQVTINQASLGSMIEPQTVKMELGTLNSSTDSGTTFEFSLGKLAYILILFVFGLQEV